MICNNCRLLHRVTICPSHHPSRKQSCVPSSTSGTIHRRNRVCARMLSPKHPDGSLVPRCTLFMCYILVARGLITDNKYQCVFCKFSYEQCVLFIYSYTCLLIVIAKPDVDVGSGFSDIWIFSLCDWYFV